MAASPERLSAEILVGDERGSGFLIAKGLVLTALHNLLGDAPSKRVERPLKAEVRFHGELQDIVNDLDPLRDAEKSAQRLKDLDLPWHQAKLVWPLTEKLAEAYDLALLQLDDPDATALEPLDFVRAHVLQNRPIGCVAHGYPTFGMEEYKVADIWELRRVEGQLEPTARLSDRMRRILVSSAPPEKLNDWQGLSGASVWIDDEARVELVGIVEARTAKLKHNNEIRCFPIGKVDDEEFWRLSGIKQTAEAKAPATAKPLASALDEELYRFDRQRATSRFRAWLAGDTPGATPIFLRAGPPNRPAIILLRGHFFDEPVECAQRFAAMLAEEFYPGLSGVYRKLVKVSCGYPEDPSQERVRQLLLDWARYYEDPTRASPNKPAATPRDIVLNGLNAPDKPRMIVLEHEGGCVTENCRGVFRDVAALLAEWQPAEPNRACPPIVILSAVVGTQAGPVEAGFKPLTEFIDKAKSLTDYLEALRDATPVVDGRPQVEFLLDLPALGDPAARMSDVRVWLNEIAARERREIPETLPLDIEDEMLTLDYFPFRFARIAIRRAMAKQGVKT